MPAQVFYGYKCPKCGSTTDVSTQVSVGGVLLDAPTCSSCGTQMQPDSQGKTSATNVQCRNCDNTFGMVNSDACPNCGQPFS